jgi:hypothetical protein
METSDATMFMGGGGPQAGGNCWRIRGGLLRYADGDARRGAGGSARQGGAMSLQPQAVYLVPEDTARVARAAFPQGNP